MEENYSFGIAFIFEGDTEKVFYHTLLLHFLQKHPNYSLVAHENEKAGEIYYILSSAEHSVLIKCNVVGTVSQMCNAGLWFQNRCHKAHSSLSWTVFLCYDTDNYSADISKFYEGDWKELRKTIERNRKSKVIDLAAQADIEDILLLDSDSIFTFLGIQPIPIPTGKKGKSKLKKIFRIAGNTYHEGEKAQPLIDALNMDVILSHSVIPFYEIENKCFI